MSNKIESSTALKFIFAGNSTVTFLNSKTGNRFTFNIKRVKDGNIFFVSALTGPEDYSYIGTFGTSGYKHGVKSNISESAQSVSVFKYVIGKLRIGALPDFVEVWHEGKCGKCGRQLTVPSSIETGIGPECAKSLSLSEKRDMLIKSILG